MRSQVYGISVLLCVFAWWFDFSPGIFSLKCEVY